MGVVGQLARDAARNKYIAEEVQWGSERATGPIDWLMWDGSHFAVRLRDGKIIAASQEEFARGMQLPPHVLRLLTEHVFERDYSRMSTRKPKRWGILSAIPEGLDGEEDWQIRRVVLGSGKGKWNSETYYASADEIGGHASFWQIDFVSIRSFRVPWNLLQSSKLSDAETEIEGEDSGEEHIFLPKDNSDGTVELRVPAVAQAR